MDQSDALHQRLQALMEDVDRDEMEEVCDVIETRKMAAVAKFKTNESLDDSVENVPIGLFSIGCEIAPMIKTRSERAFGASTGSPLKAPREPPKRWARATGVAWRTAEPT